LTQSHSCNSLAARSILRPPPMPNL
jgi:hypothetical protein